MIVVMSVAHYGSSFPAPCILRLPWRLVTGEGTFLETTIYVARQFGAPPEDLWPYQPLNRKLPVHVTWTELDRAAEAYKAQLTQVQDLDNVLGALDKNMTVLVAANATKSWYSEPAARTGLIKPASNGDPPIGGTVITLVAYDPATRRFKFANNWGPQWGEKGFGYFDSADAKTILYLEAGLWSVAVPPPTR